MRFLAWCSIPLLCTSCYLPQTAPKVPVGSWELRGGGTVSRSLQQQSGVEAVTDAIALDLSGLYAWNPTIEVGPVVGLGWIEAELEDSGIDRLTTTTSTLRVGLRGIGNLPPIGSTIPYLTATGGIARRTIKLEIDDLVDPALSSSTSDRATDPYFDVGAGLRWAIGSRAYVFTEGRFRRDFVERGFGGPINDFAIQIGLASYFGGHTEGEY